MVCVRDGLRFLGGRFDLVIKDDVYDPRKMRSRKPVKICVAGGTK